MACVEASVEMSASVSFEVVDGVSETGGVMEIIIEGDSWMKPSTVGGCMSVDTTTICSSCVNHDS